MKAVMTIFPLLVGACVTVVGTTEPGKRPTLPDAPYAPGGIVPGPSCDQTALDPALIIGRRPEDIGVDAFPFPVRVIPPGAAVTMDYSPARLNLETDASGYIVRFRCG